MVRAQGETSDGYHVEGLGTSLLSSNEAISKAISSTQRMGQQADFGYSIEKYEGGYDVTFRENRFEVSGGASLTIRRKVRIVTQIDGKSVNATGKAFRTQPALTRAVQKAKTRFQQMSGAAGYQQG